MGTGQHPLIPYGYPPSNLKWRLRIGGRAGMADAAAQLKAEGNRHFGAGRFADAAASYTAALSLREDAVFLSNRCACLLKLGNVEDALKDALKSKELRPKWAKAHCREASVLQAMGRYTEAARAFCDAMELEPTAEIAALLRGAMRGGQVCDDPGHLGLHQRCLAVLRRAEPTLRSSGSIRGRWKRCVLPAHDGPAPRAGATLSAVGSSLYLIGGLDAQAGADMGGGVKPAKPTDAVFRLDTTAEPSAWVLEEYACTQQAMAGHSACVRGNTIWVFGGHDQAGAASADLHALDTQAGADGQSCELADLHELHFSDERTASHWAPIETTGKAPAAREMHSGSTCTVAGVPMLAVHGGRSRGEVLRDMWLLRLDILTWHCFVSDHARCSHGLSLRPGVGGNSSELVLFGGFDGKGVADATLTCLVTCMDGVLDVLWEDVSGLLKGAPRARFAHAQAATSRATYVFGGAGSDGACLADTSRLDLENESAED